MTNPGSTPVQEPALEDRPGQGDASQLIHTLSNRRGRFAAVNCGAIPNELLKVSGDTSSDTSTYNGS
jgi:hypothetical protein